MEKIVEGRLVYKSSVVGKVVSVDQIGKVGGDKILVVSALTADIILLLGKVSGIVAQKGGVTSHPAIICRENKVPCIICPALNTNDLKNYTRIEINSTKSFIKLKE